MPRTLIIALSVACALGACSAPPQSWVCFYGTNSPAELLADNGIVVLDSAFVGEVAPIQRHRAKVLGYISLGELNAQRPQFAQAKQQGLLVLENPNWPGAWMVDVRDKRWHKLIIDDMAPQLLAKGFDGFFLDTVDSSLNLEDQDPTKWKGMKAAVTELIAGLHRAHPQAKLMLNGALPIVGALREAVQMVAIESSLTTWDFVQKSARWRTTDERQWALTRMFKAKADNPKLQIYTLDYWDPLDRDGVVQIYRQQRADGFVPYVATIALDRVIPEPKPIPADKPVAPALFGGAGP